MIFADFPTLRGTFFDKICLNFRFLSSMSARSRRTLRDHKDRGGPEAGNLQPQFKNSENFVFIFQIRKQQETRKI